MGKENPLQLDERQLLNLHEVPQHIGIKTPARICLFGDHQDYLGLPIIACAINRYMTFEGIKNGIDAIELLLPDMDEKRIIPIDTNRWETLLPIDFFVAGLRVVRRYGCIPSEGYRVTISSDIPMNAGVSSSSALTVGWIHFLLKTFGCKEVIISELIAKLAYEAEVVEHQSPGGKMDQYTIALGNTIFLDTEKDLAMPLGNKLSGLILAESGIAKETIGTLKNARQLAEKAIAAVQKVHTTFDIHQAIPSEINTFASILNEELRPYFEAAIENHSLTQMALKEMQQPHPNPEKLGQFMTQHHSILKTNLRVSHPQIDHMLEAAIVAGAFGGKIVGSGGGGCAVVLAPKEKIEKVIAAFKKAGAKTAYEVQISNGSEAYGL